MIGTVEEGREDMGVAAARLPPEAIAAWVEYEPPTIQSTNPLTIATGVMRHAFMSGFLAARRIEAGTDETPQAVQPEGREDMGVAATPPGGIPNADYNRIAVQLEFVARQIERWLEWDTEDRRKENLETDRDTYIMSLPVPFWPSHGMFRNWIALFNEAAQAIEARQGGDGEAGSVHESAVPKGGAR